MTTKITPDEWYTAIQEGVSRTDVATVSSHAKDKLIELTFSAGLNTIEVFEHIPDSIQKRTEMRYTPQNDSIKLSFASSRQKQDTVYHTKLLERILSEDIPAREGFEVDYTIHPNFISVTSPRKKPIELFTNVDTKFWVFSGLYKSDSTYIQQYRQAKSLHGDTLKEQKPKLKQLRLEQILFHLTLTCPNCNQQTLEYFSQENYHWSCSSCSATSGKTDPDDIIHTLNACNKRETIVTTLQDQASRSVSNHNLEQFEE